MEYSKAITQLLEARYSPSEVADELADVLDYVILEAERLSDRSAYVYTYAYVVAKLRECANELREVDS